MKVTKSIFTVAFSLLLASLAGCGGEKQASVDPNAPVDLTIWTHEDQNRTELEQRLIREFQKDNPNITVNYVTYPSGKIKDILVAGFAANEGPDIFNIEINDEYPFVVNGRVAPVDAVAAGFKDQKALEDAYMSKMLDPVKMDGKIYGLPLELTNWCVYLNKKIFRDAGLDSEKDAPKRRLWAMRRGSRRWNICAILVLRGKIWALRRTPLRAKSSTTITTKLRCRSAACIRNSVWRSQTPIFSTAMIGA